MLVLVGAFMLSLVRGAVAEQSEMNRKDHLLHVLQAICSDQQGQAHSATAQQELQRQVALKLQQHQVDDIKGLQLHLQVQSRKGAPQEYAPLATVLQALVARQAGSASTSGDRVRMMGDDHEVVAFANPLRPCTVLLQDNPHANHWLQPDRRSTLATSAAASHIMGRLHEADRVQYHTLSTSRRDHPSTARVHTPAVTAAL